MLKGLLPLVFLVACDVVGSRQGFEPPQPIAFSHALHAGEYKVDCAYCHFGVERSRHAGVPPASVCMNCHTKVKTDSPEIAKIQTAVTPNPPPRWPQVPRFPDFAYFNHASHVVSGEVACQTCPGPVETMVRIRQTEPMTMGWCLDCHRETARASGGQKKPPTDCSACHF